MKSCEFNFAASAAAYQKWSSNRKPTALKASLCILIILIKSTFFRPRQILEVKNEKITMQNFCSFYLSKNIVNIRVAHMIIALFRILFINIEKNKN